MQVYLKQRTGADAVGIYDPEKKEFIVKKGSKVSDVIHSSEKFRGTKTIAALREKYVENGIVNSDVYFKSPSTAANFITGSSTNGLVAWKNKDGIKLKDIV